MGKRSQQCVARAVNPAVFRLHHSLQTKSPECPEMDVPPRKSGNATRR
jgi:hypothetical protein